MEYASQQGRSMAASAPDSCLLSDTIQYSSFSRRQVAAFVMVGDASKGPGQLLRLGTS